MSYKKFETHVSIIAKILQSMAIFAGVGVAIYELYLSEDNKRSDKIEQTLKMHSEMGDFFLKPFIISTK